MTEAGINIPASAVWCLNIQLSVKLFLVKPPVCNSETKLQTSYLSSDTDEPFQSAKTCCLKLLSVSVHYYVLKFMNYT